MPLVSSMLNYYVPSLVPKNSGTAAKSASGSDENTITVFSIILWIFAAIGVYYVVSKFIMPLFKKKNQ